MANVSNEVTLALAEVEKKVQELSTALHALHQLHDTRYVGLCEWIEDLDNSLFELKEDINEDLDD